MEEKEKNQRHESTIDKYFYRTADCYNVWAEEDEEGRNFLQIAAEITGDTDEEGKLRCDVHFAGSGKSSVLASVIAKAMETEEFVRSIILTAARTFLKNK